MNKSYIKISLILLFALCLFHMPYWYYQLVKIFGTIGLGYLAWIDYKDKIKITPILFGIGAILFNPIIKISFDRNAWQVIDVIFALIIVLSMIFEKYFNKYLKDR